MLFSDNIMALFQTRDISLSPGLAAKPYFSIKGSFFDIMGVIKAIHADNSRSAAGVRAHRDADTIATWCGFRGQSLSDVFQNGIITAAVEDFKKASAKIETHLTPGKIDYSPVGGSFSMGRFLEGHPICMYNRQKTKLPPKTINLSINCRASLDPEDLTKSLAPIIKAAWEYQSAGGLVTLTVNYIHQFARAQVYNGVAHAGLIITLNIPLANPGILASAASVQFYRGIGMPIAVYLSGAAPDGLPVITWSGPGIFPLNGTKQDNAALSDLKIR